MLLTLIKKNRLNTFYLPQNINGSHWITDYENGRKLNLINIEEENGSWKLISNQDCYVVDNKNVMIPFVILKEYSFYLIKNNYKNETYYLYCSPIYDKTYKQIGINTDEKIVMGSSKKCELAYNLGGIPGSSFSISKENNYFYVNILDNASSVFVNQKRVLTKKRLEYGDIIFNFGLKIILMRGEGKDYLLVNNPNNLLSFNASLVNIVPVKSEFIEDGSELPNESLYKDSEFFYRTPHFYKALKAKEVNVDTPPTRKGEDQTPAMLTIGPMITMSMTSVIMLLSTINQVTSGQRDASSATTSIVMCAVMLASSLLWPLLTRAYQKYETKRYELRRQRLYKKYIDKIEKDIDKSQEEQRNILLENNITVSECQQIIKEASIKLWQRRLADEDFLTLPVGFGNKNMLININYPEEHFTLEEDNLLTIAHTLGEKERILKDVPILYSFYKNVATGIVGDSLVTKDFIDRLMLQIMANYSYDEVKLVTLTSFDNENNYDYMKTLPHSYSNDKAFRFFGSSNDDYREIMYVLEGIYNQRKTSNESSKHNPHYVIVTDAIKSIDSYDFLKEIMSSEINYGFSIIILATKLLALPNECKNFINVSKEECSIYSSIISEEKEKFRIDFSNVEDIYECARILSNIKVDIKNDAELVLPDIYHFLEMYQVGKVEQLNSKERWKRSNPILSLQAPIGIGKNGEVVNLDLHEKYHGPHGLIAGTTGSGKSELIMSYILSLCVNYHPDEVQVILIDYKGGSLAGAFSNDKYELPHVAGTITNLDGNELNRSLASIESELKRRQRCFNEAKNLTGESTMDIYKYQKLYREGKLDEIGPVSHLFIISDEFAELKEQQPDFMDKLISAARVGRALGVHLILATQKPGGVVDPQIWSNTRFRICLKVQDTSDSQEVLKKPDAAYLKKTGRFYLQVGYDEVFTLGQAAWAGSQYYPSNMFKRDVDTSINVINNIGFVTTSKDIENNTVIESKGEEISNVVKYLSDLGRNENIKAKKLWLPKIPEKIYLDSLKSKYNFVRTPYIIEPIIGEYDDPDNQVQNALHIPLTTLGNAIIYGIAGSGKETFLKSILYSSMTTYTPQEVNFYIVDFGAETLRKFSSSPYVGDVVLMGENDKLKNLFKMINAQIEIRKKALSNYGGNYVNFIKESSIKMPNIVVMINNYEGMLENYDDLSEEFSQISRESTKYGIYFVVTATNDNSVRIRTKQNFSLVYALNQNSEYDYSDILGNVKGKLPGKNKGRGLFRKGNVYEFQTAFIGEDENNILKNYFEQIKDAYEFKAKRIPVLPEKVDYEYLQNDLNDPYNLIVGVDKNSLSIQRYNYQKNSINLISSYDIENTANFVKALIKESIYMKGYKVSVVNTTEISLNIKGIKEITNSFDKVIDVLNNFIEDNYQKYEANSFNSEIISKVEKKHVFIYGVYDFINKLSFESKNALLNIMKKNASMNIISFVFVDTADSIRNFAYDEWFKTGSDTTRGIWIGSGIADQNLFKISRIEREDREEIPTTYGYLIQSSKINRIKLLSDFTTEK